MAFYNTRLFKDSGKNHSYKQRLSIVNDICNFILKCKNKLLSTDKSDLLKHTLVDIQAIRVLVLDYMGLNDYCNPSQSKIAEKIGVEREAVCKALGRLEQAGFIYKTVRFQEKKTDNQHGKFSAARKTTLGYCLTPNLRSRIFNALKSGENYLQAVDLSECCKQINLFANKIIKKFFNGKSEVEYITPNDAIERKKERIVNEEKILIDKKHDAVKAEDSFTNKSLSDGLKELGELIKLKRQPQAG